MKSVVSYYYFFFFSSRRRHTRCYRDWSSDVCSSDLDAERAGPRGRGARELPPRAAVPRPEALAPRGPPRAGRGAPLLMKTVATVDYVVIAAYMLLMVGIGVYAARFNRDASDYFRGAHRIPWLVAGLSSFMSGFSAWTFTGAAGLAYKQGLVAILLYLGNA